MDVHIIVVRSVYISFYSIYAYQISDLHLNDQNVGPSAPCQGRFPALGGLAHTCAYHCISFCMNNMHTKFQTPVLINNEKLKWEITYLGCGSCTCYKNKCFIDTSQCSRNIWIFHLSLSPQRCRRSIRTTKPLNIDTPLHKRVDRFNYYYRVGCSHTHI